jgi:hypothetical protein
MRRSPGILNHREVAQAYLAEREKLGDEGQAKIESAQSSLGEIRQRILSGLR